MHEQHGVVLRDLQQLAQIGLGLRDDGLELRPAVAHFHHAHAAAVPVEHLGRGLFQHLFRNGGRPGGEVVGALLDHLGSLRGRVGAAVFRRGQLSRGQLVVVRLHHRLHLDEMRLGVERDQGDALRRPAHFTNLFHPRAHQYTGIGDQHDFIAGAHQAGRHHLAVALRSLDGNHALGTAPMTGVFGDGRALAVAVFRGGEHALGFVFGHQQGNDGLIGFKLHAAHSARLAAHRAHIGLVETHRLACVGKQHDVVLTIRNGRTDEVVVLVQRHRDDARSAPVDERRQRRLFHRAARGRHEHIVLLVEGLDRQYGGDLLTRLQRKQIDQRFAARAASAHRRLVYLHPVHPAPVGEAQQHVVGVGHEQLLDPVVFLGARGQLAPAAAALRTVFRQRLALDVARVRDGDHQVLRGDEVFDIDVVSIDLDVRATRIAELGTQGAHFGGDDFGHALRLGKDVEQIGDLFHDVLVFADDLVLLQAGQALQPHLQDFLRLRLAEVITVGFEAVTRVEIVGLELGDVTLHARQHGARLARLPGLRQQTLFRHRRRGRGLDEFDHAIDIGQRHSQTFEHMPTFTRFAQVEHRAAGDDLAAVRQKGRDHLLKVEQTRLTIHQRHHVDAKGVLQLGLLVQIIEHHFRHFAALEFDDHAHARLVRLVLDVADAFDLFLLHQLGDALKQGAFVDLVRQLVDDDGLTLTLFKIFKVATRPHHHPSASGAIGVSHSRSAIDDARCREVGRRHALHQLLDRRPRVAQQMQTGVEHLAQVVRRNIGGHAHRNARRAIDQQIGQTRRQQQRLLLGAVIVGAEIDGFLVDIGQHFVRDLRQPDFGVAHGRGVVAVHRAEVALSVHQHVAQGKILRHAHDGVVHRLVTVRVVFTDHVTHDARRLFVRPIPGIAQFVHRIQHAPMHRLEAISHIGKCTTHDHAHRVI